jgi:serine phosphatase RsbU (regulator of sigma subunit)
MDIQKILQRVPLLSGLAPEALASISTLFEEETHPAEARIIEEGAPGDSMFILVSGRVKITKNAGDDSEVLITKLAAGSYFGEVALIENKPRSANVITDVESTVLRLKKSAFDSMLNENADFAISFYRNCLNETMARMRETATNLTVSQNVLSKKSSRLDKIDEDLSDAAAIQDYFLSKEQLQDESLLMQGIKQSYIYRPYLEVGGDFLNITRLAENRYGIIIADVMGHGISAAMATGVLRSAFSIFSKEVGSDPAELMFRMNNHMYEIFPSLFTTSYYAVIDRDASEVKMTKAGHMHPLIWKAEQNGLMRIDPPGPGLGIMAQLKFTETRIPISKGDKILFYTDGIIEQKGDDGEMYSHERLERKFEEYCLEEREHIIQDLFQDLEQFKGKCEFQDDVTFLLLEFSTMMPL